MISVKKLIGTLRLNRLLSRLRGLMGHPLPYFLAFLGKPKATTKFIILTTGRSGSEELIDIINNHQEIKCDSEILYRHRILPVLLVRGCSKQSQKRVYGFKFKNQNMPKSSNEKKRMLITRLYKNGWKIIYLTRRDVLRRVLSEFIARGRNGLWHISHVSRDKMGKNILNKKIRIRYDELIKRIDQILNYNVFNEELLKNKQHIKLIYEDNLSSEKKIQETADAVFSYLGLTSVPVKTKYLKTTPDDLSTIIENYDELIDHLRKSEYLPLITL